MTFIKTTGIVILTAALLVSGGFYFTMNNTIKQQQQAEKAEVTATSNEKAATEDWDNFEEPLQQVEDAPEDSKDTKVATTGDIAALTDQINRLQQHMFVQMRTCATNAQVIRNSVNGLEARYDQLEAQRVRINDQLRGIDRSTPEGQNRRNELLAERNRIEDQKDAARKAVTEAKKRFSTLRADCRRAVNETRSQKRTAESQLQRAYNSSMSYRLN